MKHILYDGPEVILHHEVGEIVPGVNLVSDSIAERLLASGGRFRNLPPGADIPPPEQPAAEELPTEAPAISALVDSIFDPAEEEPKAPPSRPRKGKE